MISAPREEPAGGKLRGVRGLHPGRAPLPGMSMQRPARRPEIDGTGDIGGGCRRSIDRPEALFLAAAALAPLRMAG